MASDPYLFETTNIVCAAIVVLLLVLSALISGAETAFFSLSPDDIKNSEKDKSRKGKRMFDLLQAPDKLSATCRVADSFVNVTIVILAVYTLTGIFDFDEIHGWEFVFWAAAVSLPLLLFGEFIPKMHASQNALKVSRRTAYTMTILQKIFYPSVTLFVSSVAFVQKQVRKSQSISIDDLSDALEKTSDVGAENENILKGIVKFGNIDAHTIMTPRMDVESVDINTRSAELFALINEWGYSRIPVYDDAPDNVKGILYVKDLLPYIEESDDFGWQKLIRPAYFVPEHKKIDDLLKEFQEIKMHIAVIIDEYGAMVGIVTLEDILEEIVGEIADESDDDEPDFVQIDDRTYLFDGKVLLNDFFRIMRIDDTFFADVRGEAETLAGIFLELKGEIPQKGDCVNYKNLTLSVESVDNRRIKQIKVIVDETEK